MAEDIDTAPAQAAPSERGGASDGRLPLMLTVGFTGHRSVDDVDAAARLIAATFADVKAAFDLITASPLAAAFEGKPRLRLLAGGAPGTDRLAQDAWRKGQLGELHAIYPFQNPATGGAATDDPSKKDPATLVDPGPEFGPWTGIDALALGLEPAQAHAEVGRWLVRHADLLVAWWDGKQGHGLGGANDTVRRALERGLPVIWLSPGAATARLISLASARHQGDATEALEAPATVAVRLTPAALADILGPALGPPSETGPEADHADAAARRDYAKVDPTVLPPGPVGLVRRLADHSLWRSYRLFERVAGGKRAPARPSLPPPAAVTAQPGFVRLLQAAHEAGARANHLSGIHRSEQVQLIWIAMAAVFFGAAPALDLVRNYHLEFAWIEFLLGFFAFAVTLAAQRAHRHRRWSDARRLAERLGSALATWPLGFDVADARAGPAEVWTEWRALAVLRAAGPPPRLDHPRPLRGDRRLGGRRADRRPDRLSPAPAHDGRAHRAHAGLDREHRLPGADGRAGGLSRARRAFSALVLGHRHAGERVRAGRRRRLPGAGGDQRLSRAEGAQRAAGHRLRGREGAAGAGQRRGLPPRGRGDAARRAAAHRRRRRLARPGCCAGASCAAPDGGQPPFQLST